MSGNGVFYDDEGQSIPRPYPQDPEPEPTLEKEPAKVEAIEFDDRLVITATFVVFQSKVAIFS